MARKISSKGTKLKPGKTPAEPGPLDSLTPDEANAILHGLLKKHPELQSEAEKLALNIVASPSIEEIADEVFHALTGNWSDHRDCHVKPDLLLIYRKPDPNRLQLIRLGSHSELGL